MNYSAKDIFLQRATSNNTFEEYKLTIQTSSIVASDTYGNLSMISPFALTGTASVATSASHAGQSDFAQTASYAVLASYEIVFETSASHAEEADYALEALSASYVPNLYPQEYLPSASWASSSISSSYVPNLYPQEYLPSASWASASISASYVPNLYPQEYLPSASWASASISASYVPNLYPQVQQDTVASASWVSASVRITAADTASYVANAASASYVPNLYPQEYLPSASWASASISASYVPNLYPQEYLPSASWASASISASYVPNLYPQEYLPSASWSSASISASYSETASYALQALSASWAPQPIVPEFVASASWASSSISASYVPNLYPQEYLPSASWASASISASYVPNLYPQEYLPSASWASASLSASYAISASHLDADTLHLGRLGGDGGTIELYDGSNDAYYSIHGADEAIEVNKTFIITNGDLVLNSGFFNGNGSHITNIIFASSSISSSWASQSLSASHVPNLYPQEYLPSASWASSSISSSYVPNLYPQEYLPSASWASASISASYVPNLYPQEYLPSASWASASISASYVPNLYPQVQQDTVASASWVSASVRITAADTASYVANAASASYVPNLYPQEYLPSASWASASISASYVPNLYPQEYLPSASWASASLSASYSDISNGVNINSALAEQEYSVVLHDNTSLYNGASFTYNPISTTLTIPTVVGDLTGTASYVETANTANTASSINASTIRIGGSGVNGTVELYDLINDSYYTITTDDDEIRVEKTLTIANPNGLIVEAGTIRGDGSQITNINGNNVSTVLSATSASVLKNTNVEINGAGLITSSNVVRTAGYVAKSKTFTGTGTIIGDGGFGIVGNGTVFTQELAEGAYIETAGGNAFVTNITDDENATVSSPIDDLDAYAFTYIPPALSTKTTSGKVAYLNNFNAEINAGGISGGDFSAGDYCKVGLADGTIPSVDFYRGNTRHFIIGTTDTQTSIISANSAGAPLLPSAYVMFNKTGSYFGNGSYISAEQDAAIKIPAGTNNVLMSGSLYVKQNVTTSIVNTNTLITNVLQMPYSSSGYSFTTTNPQTGSCYYECNGNLLYIYNGIAWKSCSLS